MRAHTTIYLCEWIESYGLTHCSICITHISILWFGFWQIM